MPIIVTRDFPPGRGGVQRYCEGLAAALYDRFADICVVAPAIAGADSFDRSVPYSVIRVVERGRATTALATVGAIRRARTLVRDTRIIAAIWQPCGYEAILSGAIGANRPIVVAHGSEITRQKSGIRRLLASLVLRNAEVVAVSNFTAQAVRSLGASARVVPVGIPHVSHERRQSREPQILIVGRLVRRKGFDRMIRAIAALSTELPGLSLDVVGTGPDLHYLRQIACECDVESRVRFHGSVSEERLDELYSAAWFFAMPNRTEEGYDVEGLGIVFLEAAMHGIPSIGGIRSGAEDAIIDGETGILVDGGSQSEVTAAVRALASDPARCKSLGETARARVLREFDWGSIVEKLLDRTA